MKERYIQIGTGHVALLVRGADGSFVVDVFRRDRATSTRMGSWVRREDAEAALAGLRFMRAHDEGADDGAAEE